jgi:PAS domain S-box-containing protein
VDEARVTVAVQARAPWPDGVARPSVLLVDDRPSNLVALEAVLLPLGLEVVRAASGEEALKHLLKQQFALVLLDVQMPGMDGFETASAIKAHSRTAELPIIFVTAISREATHIFKGYARGAVDYVLKPLDPQILRAKVSVFVQLFTKNETIKAQAKLLHERELALVERQGEDRLKLLTESMPLIVWALRRSGQVYYVNRAWTDFSGLSLERTNALDDPALCHPEDSAIVRESWRRALGEPSSFALEYRLRRRVDGAYRWHLVRATPQYQDGGAVESWIVTATDIDEHKTLQDAQERLLEKEQHARQAAESANRMKDEFLANVSHELRGPLNAILGWTGMLRTGMLEPSRVGAALQTIERSAQMQTALIEDLLDVSRITSGKVRIKSERFDVGDVVAAAVEGLRPSAVAKKQDLCCSFGEGGGSISGDPERFKQVVWNLVSNAVKFTPEGGRVEVRVERIGAMLEIVVTDSGAGISAEFLPSVFERFRQQDNSSTRSHQGLGLGLAIVRELVELHGGQVRAESAGLGLGARFSVTLPVLADSVPPPAPSSVKQQPAAVAGGEQGEGVVERKKLQGLAVLFVDDQQESRELLTEYLVCIGASVVAVDSAAEAMNALGRELPDILVSDIGLPGADGYDLIQQVRAIAPSLPAIAVTGYGRAEDRERALVGGFHMHFTKPVDLPRLVAAIVALTDGKTRGSRTNEPLLRAPGEAALPT